jgi:hypothetical protein
MFKVDNSFRQGVFGAFFVIAIFLIISISYLHIFDYRVSIEKVHVNSANLVSDSICAVFKKELVKELNENKLILTPQEYTNNVVNYYNSILLILSVMIAAFSIISFIYIRNQSRDLIQESLNSKEFQNKISEKLIGNVDSHFRDEMSMIRDKLEMLENKISYMDSKRDESKQIDL